MPVAFPVQGAAQPLYGLGREAAEGKLGFPRSKKYEYRFAAPPFLAYPASFEIEYSLAGEGRIALETGNASWDLPHSSDSGGRVNYAIPIDRVFPEHFCIALFGGQAPSGGQSQMQIHSIQFKKRWYGYYRLEENQISLSPFLAMETSAAHGGAAWEINPPAGFYLPKDYFQVFEATLKSGKEAVFDTGSRSFEASARLEYLNIPAGIIACDESPLVLSGDRPVYFRLTSAAILPFPSPITADPGMVLAWPQNNWRDKRYEVFRWENFPSLLIFDTASYAVQDRMLKRLAFFVEKAGFRGRLAPDEELDELHGWNAHDYRAEDLARFFQAARNAHFPLLAEERELERILLNVGILKESGSALVGGEGGIISISRESAEYLRYRFMAHEGFHGLFFIDEDFRNFSRSRWQQLSPEARRFIVSYFNYQRYDTSDEYLLVNEFMAHVLQQPVSGVWAYFGETLPSRIEDHPWRHNDLPAKDARTGTWPTLAAAFTREAEAFSGYVYNRWGLAAGRVHLVTVR